MNDMASLPLWLLVEPQFVLRRTIVAVAHDLGIARIQEAAATDPARSFLASNCFDGVVLDLAGGAAAFELVVRLRKGEFASRPDTPVVGLTAAASSDPQDDEVRSLGTSAVLRKPFKMAELLRQMQQMTIGSGPG